MKVIDCLLGETLRVGSLVSEAGPDGPVPRKRIVVIEEGRLWAYAVVEDLVTQERSRIRLQVRYLHPGFLFQHVAFYPN